MRGSVSAAVPRAASHQAPVADSLGSAVRVVEVGEAEKEMPEFVGTHADACILWDCQVAEDLGGVGVPGGRQYPLVRPDVVAITALLAPAAGVDDDEGVNKAVTVVVVGAEVHVRIGRVERVASEIPGARRSCWLGDTKVPVGVPGVRLRHPVRTDNIANDVDQAAGCLPKILLDASRGDDAI